MAEDEEEEGCCRPEPADFDKVDVEDVGFARKVAGREIGGVGLRRRVVGRVAVLRREDREERAQEEGAGVGGEQEGFEERG